MSGMRRWLTSTALGFVLLSVLALPPRASAVNAPSTCTPPCPNCGKSQTCLPCTCKPCPPPSNKVMVCKRCCRNPGGSQQCSTFPKCPGVSQ